MVTDIKEINMIKIIPNDWWNIASWIKVKKFEKFLNWYFDPCRIDPERDSDFEMCFKFWAYQGPKGDKQCLF